MGKKLIHGKYISNLGLTKGGKFLMKPDYILTPYVNDLLREMDIEIVYGCEEETNDDLRCRVIKILKEDYEIEKEEIVEKVLKKLVKEVN